MRLNVEGFETALAADGDMALQCIRSEHFDVVLLGVRLPVLDGWGVLDDLQSEADPPLVIVLSAHPEIDRASALGVVDCVVKPFNIDEVGQRIRRALAAADSS